MKHREICLLAAKWLNKKAHIHSATYVTVELVAQTKESPDVIGWGGVSTLIEVKISRSDFLADAKKPFRINPSEGMGHKRYYCCPDSLIKKGELPENWGLLYEVNGKIKVIRYAKIQSYNAHAENIMLRSIMRREGIKHQIFDYRK